MVITNESETVRQEDLREVQDHQEKRQDHGHLREPQAQAETGLIDSQDRIYTPLSGHASGGE
jgi:hypothetical protein